MNTTLVIAQPGPMVGCVVVAAFAAAWLGGTTTRQRLRRLAVALVPAGLGVALYRLAVPPASGWLAVLALLVGGWLMWVAVRRVADLSGVAQGGLLVLRLVAWLVLLMLVARPTCQTREVLWDRPVVALLLDRSRSMAVRDATATAESAPTRAERVNAALAGLGDVRARLNERCDVRVLSVGARATPLDDWRVTPDAPVTGVARALRAAGGLRSVGGRPAVAAVLLSDGKETLESREAVAAAAAELAEQGTAVLAGAVGLDFGAALFVELEPLVVPRRVGLRERLRVLVQMRVVGCQQAAVRLELLWDDAVAVRTPLTLDYPDERLNRMLEVVPQTLGVQRLTARVIVERGGQTYTFDTSTLVEVRADAVRVLMVERVPSTEFAFIARALQAEGDFEVARRLLLNGRAAFDAEEPWAGYDVVMLGAEVGPVPAAAWAALTPLVTDAGLGLLVAGTSAVLRGDVGADLAAALPVEARAAGEPRPRALFRLTPLGQRHPALGLDAEDTHGLVEMLATLPPVQGVNALGARKALAAMLAEDEDRQPLVVVQEAGRGRSAVVAWQECWPWALYSDAGRVWHERFWRQLVTWLANRRARAWVITDALRYPTATLGTHGRAVQVQAGVSGLPDDAPAWGRWEVSATWAASDPNAPTSGPGVDARATEPAAQPVVLHATAEGWAGELGPLPEGAAIPPGRYRVRFTARPTAGSEELYTAETSLEVVAEDPEMTPPTANLPLLRAVAARSAAVGGRYFRLAELPEVLQGLAAEDRRQRIERWSRYDIVAHDPWGIYLWLLAALTGDWLIRKRTGVA